MIILLLGVLVIVFILCMIHKGNTIETYKHHDEKCAKDALIELNYLTIHQPSAIPSMSDGDFEQNLDNIYVAKVVNSTGRTSQCNSTCKSTNIDVSDIDVNLPMLSCKLHNGIDHIELFRPPSDWQPDKTRYWMYNYYANEGDPTTTRLPPGLFSRMYYWYPGFNENGYSFHLRPGISEVKKWPRNRWVRHNDNYYYISNQASIIPTQLPPF